MENSNHFRLRSSFICLLNKSSAHWFGSCWPRIRINQTSSSIFFLWWGMAALPRAFDEEIYAKYMNFSNHWKMYFFWRKSNGNCGWIVFAVMFLIKNNNLWCPKWAASVVSPHRPLNLRARKKAELSGTESVGEFYALLPPEPSPRVNGKFHSGNKFQFITFEW